MLVFIKYFRKVIKNSYDKLIHFFTMKYEKIKVYVDYSNKDVSEISYEDLAPKDDIDKDGIYSNALDWALKNDKILNIALTGAYGSGKSSILKTYEKKRPNNNYLSISLASFNGILTNEENNEEDIANDYNDMEIEKGILQQLFYKVRSRKLPYSRFRKIRNLKVSQLIGKTLFILLTVFLGMLIFSPNSIEKAKNNFSVLQGYNFSQVVIYAIYVTFLIFTLKILIDIVRYLSKGLKLSKIKLEKAEIELEKVNDESIFNRYLDEILYFFEVTNYNIVFIEDLDRFNNINIFTKFRELNTLINNAEQIKNKIVFIYAIKDDMFVNKDRTKFFDFIIPVIPIINSNNSREILLKKIKDDNLSESMSDSFISDITIYIDDMRVLNNIYNEFSLYRQTLKGITLNLEKLLSMIVYKNLYPDDFAKLQYNEGLVYQAFDRKTVVILKMLKDNREEYIELEKKLHQIENEHLNSLKELKLAFLYAIGQGRNDVSRIDVNNQSYNTSNILSDSFDLLTLKGNSYYVYFLNGGWVNNTIDYLKSTYTSEKDFFERAELIKLKTREKQEEMKRQLINLKKKEKMMRSWSLVEIIEEIGVEDFFDKTTNQRKLIIFLLRNGYIDEMYSTYINYFYPGSLTQKDVNFIMSIKDQEALEPSYELMKVDKIIDRLTRSEFERNIILNYNLVDYILENHEKYKEYLDIIIEQLSNESVASIVFIDSFLDITRNKKIFINLLCSRWFGIWNYVMNRSNFPETKKDEYLKNVILYAEIEAIMAINKEEILTKYISNKSDFVNLMFIEEDVAKTKKVIEELHIKFERLDNPIENNELLEFIFENNLYEINKEMIELIYRVKFPASVQDLYSCNLTTIHQTNYLPLVNYINENLELYINNVFLNLENNIYEAEKTIIDLLNNTELSEEVKYKIIDKEKAVLGNIEDINSELWFKAMKVGKIKTSWVNIMSYYNSTNKIDEALISFISAPDNYKILALTKFNEGTNFEESIYEQFSNALIRCIDLDENVFINLVSSIPYKYNKIDTSDLLNTRVLSIINCSILNFTLDNFNSIRENHKNLLAIFIEKNIEAFLDEWSNLQIDSIDLTNVLDSSDITVKEKTFIISKIDEVLLSGNIELIESICEIVIAYHDDIMINTEVVQEILGSELTSTKKIKLLNKQIKYLEANNITKCLIMLGESYKNITLNSKKPLIENSVANFELLQQLKENGYIASFNKEKNGLRVYTKRK